MTPNGLSLDPVTGKVLSGPVKTILRNEGRNSTPDWSPDGEMIACRTAGSSAEPGRAALFLHSPRTGETRELTLKKTGSLNFHFLRWSPDGRRLLCIGSDEKGSYGALHAVDARAGDSEIIARSDDRGFIFGCDWAPDGKSVTITLRIYQDFSIYRDARFLIEQAGFLGDMYVAIVPTENKKGAFRHLDPAQAERPFNLQCSRHRPRRSENR